MRAGSDLSVVSGRIDSERATADNIKSKPVRTAVQKALRLIRDKLRDIRHTPINGMGVFASEDTVVAIEPPTPLKTHLYRCEKHFVLDPLPTLFRRSDGPIYGWAQITGEDAMYIDTQPSSKRLRTLRVGGKIKRHGRGGQSSGRFMRLFDNADKAWCKQIVEWLTRVIHPNTRHVFVGGPGIDSRSIDIACVPTSTHATDGDWTTWSHRVEQTLLPKHQQNHSRKIAHDCWELMQRDPQRICVGLDECRRAIGLGLVDKGWAEQSLGIDELISVEDGSLATLGRCVAVLFQAVDLQWYSE